MTVALPPKEPRTDASGSEVRSKSLTAGIIGGLGPQATAELFCRIVRQTRVANEQDHLHILIDNQPDVPNRHHSIAGTGPSAVPALEAIARNLARSGADFLLMPCNTAHAYALQIVQASGLPLIHMVEEAAEELVRQRTRIVGLLAARGCIEARLYQDALAARGISVIEPGPEELEMIMDAIFQIKINAPIGEPQERLRQIGRAMTDRGADAVLLACTEISIALGERTSPYRIVDALDVLVERTILRAGATIARRA